MAASGRGPAPRTVQLARALQPNGQAVSPGDAFLRRRLADYRRLEQAVNEGRMSHGQMRAELQRRGYLPGGVKHVEAGNDPFGLAAKVIGESVATIAYAPKGIYDIGRAVVLDERDLVDGVVERTRRVGESDAPFGAKVSRLGREIGDELQGQGSFPRTRRMAKQMAYSVASDLRHPLRHPGYTLMDVASLGLIGVGAVGKAGGVGRAASAAKAARAQGRSGAAAAAKSVLEPRPGSFSYEYRQAKAEGVRRPDKVAAQRFAKQLVRPSGRRSALVAGLGLRFSKYGRRELNLQERQAEAAARQAALARVPMGLRRAE